MIALLAFLVLMSTVASASPFANNGSEHVILLHGLCRTTTSMTKMAKALEADRYTVHNLAYPSRQQTIQELSEAYLKPVLEACTRKQATKVHFVTHSMGGILVRDFLARHPKHGAPLGKLVMLAPPNDGSEVAERLRHWRLYQWLNGPAGQQLGISEDSLPCQLGPVTIPTGVIAGDRSINWINSLTMIKGTDDGKVSVSSSKVSGMADHLVVHVTHPMIMRNKAVIRQTIHFLREGNFAR